MIRSLFCVLLAASLLPVSHGQDVLQPAEKFLNLLSDDLRTEANKPLDGADRYDWHFVPLLRKGPSLADMNDKQEQAAFDLLKASLSPTGFQKVQDIIWLENVLRAQEGNNPSKMPDGSIRRDPEKYHFLIFGDPSGEGPWAWRFEGHHVSINFTARGKELLSSTPSFFGSNPGKVNEEGFESKEVLREETALGFELVNMLDAKQKKIAIFSETAPADIFSSNHREATPLEPAGLSYADMTAKQQQVVMKMLDVYIGNYQFGFADLLHEKVEKSGYENLSFSWAGSLKRGAGHYYRIQGPVLLIEYDNTQNGANHVHSVVRDLTNDFGEDILRAHYASDH